LAESKDLDSLLDSTEEPAAAPAEDVSECERCAQNEAEVSKAQQQLNEVQKALENSEKAVFRARDELNKERTSRQELETKWSAIKDQYDEQVPIFTQIITRWRQHVLHRV